MAFRVIFISPKKYFWRSLNDKRLSRSYTKERKQQAVANKEGGDAGKLRNKSCVYEKNDGSHHGSSPGSETSVP